MAEVTGTSQEVLDIYVHVPKTAGTTLRMQLPQNYGDAKTWGGRARRLFFPATAARYNPRVRLGLHEEQEARRPDSKPDIRLGPLRDLYTAERAYRHGSAIIGHFRYDLFDDMTDQRPARYFTVIRDPLDRMVSHYNYLQQRRHKPAVWMEGNQPDLPFGDFALTESVRDFQTQYVGPNFHRYTAVGVTEQMDGFLHATGLIDSEPVPTVNPTHNSLRPLIADDPVFIRDFQAFHAQDYDLYQQAVDHAPQTVGAA